MLLVAQSLVALVVGIVAARYAPQLSTAAEWHKEFDEFFSACASVTVALLIALAIEARDAVRKVPTAAITAGTLAVGIAAATLALTPMPLGAYRWLFGFAAAGGAGGLVAVCVIGAQLLKDDIWKKRRENLNEVAGD
jgi:hypothetical protein